MNATQTPAYTRVDTVVHHTFTKGRQPQVMSELSYHQPAPWPNSGSQKSSKTAGTTSLRKAQVFSAGGLSTAVAYTHLPPFFVLVNGPVRTGSRMDCLWIGRSAVPKMIRSDSGLGSTYRFGSISHITCSKSLRGSAWTTWIAPSSKFVF